MSFVLAYTHQVLSVQTDGNIPPPIAVKITERQALGISDRPVGERVRIQIEGSVPIAGPDLKSLTKAVDSDDVENTVVIHVPERDLGHPCISVVEDEDFGGLESSVAVRQEGIDIFALHRGNDNVGNPVMIHVSNDDGLGLDPHREILRRLERSVSVSKKHGNGA